MSRHDFESASPAVACRCAVPAGLAHAIGTKKSDLGWWLPANEPVTPAAFHDLVSDIGSLHL
jgi:hypothetical protein